MQTVTIKTKYNDFKLITRSKTLNEPIDSYEELYSTGKYILYQRVPIDRPIRLIGMQVSNFVYPYEPIQMTFTDIIGDV